MYKNDLIDLLSALLHFFHRPGRIRTAEERERRAAEHLKSMNLHARMPSISSEPKAASVHSLQGGIHHFTCQGP